MDAKSWLCVGLSLALLSCLAATGSAAQEPPACTSCKDRGLLPCKLCATKLCNSERGYLFCSVECECSDCGGARFRECNYCERAPERDLPARRAELAAWRATREGIDEHMAKRDILHLESAHFELVFELHRLEVKGAGSPHAAAHVYLDRLERLFADFQTDSGCAPEDFHGKTRVMLWGNEKDQEKASSKWTLERSSSLAKLMGKDPVVSLCFGKGRLRDDEDLHHAVVHQVAHCLLSNVHQSVWLGGRKAGWLDEGVAHLYEVRYFGAPSTWCSLSDEAVEKLKFARFESELLARVNSGKVVALGALSGLDTVALSPEQRLFAWSYCDYLARVHPGRLGLIAKSLQQEKPTSEAIQIGVNVALADFQLDWATWVKSSYSAKRK